MLRNKALKKTLFHFFSHPQTQPEKNERVFCAVAIEIQIIFLCGGGFLIIYFIAVACLIELSVRQVVLKKTVR